MRYILHLKLDGFFIRQGAASSSGPLAVVRDGIVLDVNAEARARGMSVGMEKRTARSIVHEAEFIEWQEDRYEEAQRQWLDLCIDFTGIIEPEEQNSAYLDLSGHPNPIDVSEKLIRTLAQETGLRIFYGSSCSKWIAKLATSQGDCGLATTNPAQFLAGLPISKLTPVSPEHRQRLHFLGYRNIGDISKIPAEVLRQQFGAEGLFIAKAARGDFMDSPRPVYPKDSLIESLIFDGPVESLETIDLALKDLAHRVGERLSSKSLQGQELELTIELEDGQILKEKRKFSKPIHNPPGALAALRLLSEQTLMHRSAIRDPRSAIDVTPEGLEDISRSVGRDRQKLAHADTCRPPVVEPIHKHPEGVLENSLAAVSAVMSIRLQMTNLQHNREKQKELLGHARANDSSAFQHVRTVFGDTAVQLGGEIPVPRRVQVLREWKNAIGWS